MVKFRPLIFAVSGAVSGMLASVILIVSGIGALHRFCPAVFENYLTEIVEDQRCLFGRSFLDWLIAKIQSSVGAFNFLLLFVAVSGFIGIGLGMLVHKRRVRNH